jgi:hypothetical protein
VPFAIAIIPSLSALCTDGNATTPFAINRFDSATVKTTLAFAIPITPNKIFLRKQTGTL